MSTSAAHHRWPCPLAPHAIAKPRNTKPSLSASRAEVSTDQKDEVAGFKGAGCGGPFGRCQDEEGDSWPRTLWARRWPSSGARPGTDEGCFPLALACALALGVARRIEEGWGRRVMGPGMQAEKGEGVGDWGRSLGLDLGVRVGHGRVTCSFMRAMQGDVSQRIGMAPFSDASRSSSSTCARCTWRAFIQGCACIYASGKRREVRWRV
jgi:hypothetical protein